MESRNDDFLIKHNCKHLQSMGKKKLFFFWPQFSSACKFLLIRNEKSFALSFAVCTRMQMFLCPIDVRCFVFQIVRTKQHHKLSKVIRNMFSKMTFHQQSEINSPLEVNKRKECGGKNVALGQCDWFENQFWRIFSWIMLVNKISPTLMSHSSFNLTIWCQNKC